MLAPLCLALVAALPVESHTNLSQAPIAVGSIARILGTLPDGGTLMLVNHPSTGNELWAVTSSGVTFLRDFTPGLGSGSYGPDFVAHGDRTYFAANDGTGLHLWSTDGTVDGTVVALDGGLASASVVLNAGRVFVAGASPNRLLTWSSTPSLARELTLSDGGTLAPGGPQIQSMNGSEVVFTAGSDFYRSDGGIASRMTGVPASTREWQMLGSTLGVVYSGFNPGFPPFCPPTSADIVMVADTLAPTVSFTAMTYDAGVVAQSACRPGLMPGSIVFEMFQYSVLPSHPIFGLPGAIGAGGTMYVNLYWWTTFLPPVYQTNPVTGVILPRSTVAGSIGGPVSSYLPGSSTLAFATAGGTLYALDGQPTLRPTGISGAALRAQVLANDRTVVGHGLPDGGAALVLWLPDAGPASSLAWGNDPNAAMLGPANRVSATGLGFHSTFDAGTGTEPWWTDLTAGGTFAVANLRSDERSSNPTNLVSAADGVYFSASSVPGQVELHRALAAAGTGTQLVDLSATDSGVVAMLGAARSGEVYFTAREQGRNGIWRWADGGATELDNNDAGQLNAWFTGGEVIYMRGASELTWLYPNGQQRQRLLTSGIATSAPAVAQGRLFLPLNTRVLEVQLPGQPQVLTSTRAITLAQNAESAFAFTTTAANAVELYAVSDPTSAFARLTILGNSLGGGPPIISRVLSTRDTLTFVMRTTAGRCEIRRVDLPATSSSVLQGPWEFHDCNAPIARVGAEVWVSAWSRDAGMEPWRIHLDGGAEQVADVVPGFLGAGLSDFARAGTSAILTGYDRGGDLELYRAALGDPTPVEVQTVLRGDAGLNGWFTSDVDLSFVVSDPESETVILEGCRPGMLTSDGVSPPITCAADSLGGPTTVNLVLKRDATPPWVFCPPSVQVDATAPMGASVRLGPSDAGDALTQVQVTQMPPGPIYPIGMNVVTVRATDEAGNIAECATMVTVVDRPPTIECPGGVNREASSREGAVIPFPVARVTDTVSPLAPVAVVDGGADQGDGGVRVPLGMHLVELQVTDLSGNTARCTLPVDIYDRTPPALTCPDLLVTAPVADAGTVTVEYAMVQAFDAVSDVTPVFTPASGTDFALGDTEVHGEAIDDAGNRGTCTFNVHVEPCSGPCGKTVIPRSLYRWSCAGCSAGAVEAMVLLGALLLLRRRRRR